MARGVGRGLTPPPSLVFAFDTDKMEIKFGELIYILFYLFSSDANIFFYLVWRYVESTYVRNILDDIFQKKKNLKLVVYPRHLKKTI